MSEERCHCGRPLHYVSQEIRQFVEEVTKLAGGDPFVTVTTTSGRSFRVQRHYIALHGLSAHEIPDLGFEEITDGVRTKR